jgi:hypothetical protein
MKNMEVTDENDFEATILISGAILNETVDVKYLKGQT